MRYRLHGVHGYRLGRHWNIVYEIAALFYRVRRMVRGPDYSVWSVPYIVKQVDGINYLIPREKYDHRRREDPA
jgi:hypothetical protein